MTNYDRALRVLEDARRPGEHRIHPNDAVEALAQAGLLAPDLPEPSYTVPGCKEENPVWEATTQFKVEADPDSQELYIWNDYGPAETLSLAKANTMRRALHAAEVYLEEA